MKKSAFIIAIIICILTFTVTAEARQASRGEDFVKDMNILFLRADYSSLVVSAEKNMKRYRLDRREKKEVLYLMGLSYIKLKDFANARRIFNNILDMKGEEFRENAHIGIADSYFGEGLYDKAIESYENILTMYPRTDRTSSISYNLGQCYAKKGDSDKAKSYLQNIKKKYDSSLEADKVPYIPQEGKPSYYVIQLGAFRSLTNAKKLTKELARKGYEYYIQKVTAGGKVLYKVRCGKFSNEEYTARLLRKLKRDGFSAKIIEE